MKTSHKFIMVVDHMEMIYTPKGDKQFKVVGWKLWSPSEAISIVTDKIYPHDELLRIDPQARTLEVI